MADERKPISSHLLNDTSKSADQIAREAAAMHEAGYDVPPGMAKLARAYLLLRATKIDDRFESAGKKE